MYKTEENSLTLKTNLMVTKGERGGGVKEFGVNICILLCIKYRSNKDLLYSTGNSTQYSVIT